MDWVYSSNATFVAEARSRGLRGVSLAMNDEPNATTYSIGRMRSMNRGLITAPWMRTWTNPPFWGCVNNPDYLKIAFARADELVAAGATLIQHDDPTMNEGATQWNGGDPHNSGCYCDHCISGFTGALMDSLDPADLARLNVTRSFNYSEFILSGGGKAAGDAVAKELRTLFVQFQENSTRRYHVELQAHVSATAGHHVAFSGNNGVRGWPSPYDLMDVGIGELPKCATNPGGLRHVFVDELMPGKQQALTMPKEAPITAADVFLTRWAIAFSYALGGNMLVPWDIYLPDPNADRFFGSAAQFGDIFAFIREPSISEILMACDEAVASFNSSQLSLVHTGAAGDGMRWRLPTDTPATRGRHATACDEGACRFECEADAQCVGIFYEERQCYVLYELQLVSGTAVQGNSYARNASVSPGPFQSDADGLALVARRSSNQSNSVVAIHAVDWRYALFATDGEPPVQANVTATLNNTVLFGSPGCNTVDATLRQPGGEPGEPLQVACKPGSGVSVLEFPAPRPWSVVQLDIRS